MTHVCVLRVSGIPASQYEDDLLLDKLLIHFLRHKNGGNGEVDVQYPTEERGVAMLTFDLVEVAEQVLTRTHLLEIRGRTYPLEVSRPQRQRTQFSMPITTILSLKYFDDISEVRVLLEKHNLRVCREKSSYLSIEGDFQDLSRCRDELYKTMSNSSHHVENRMSRKDWYHAKEYSPDQYHVSGEEAHMQKSTGKQSPIDSLPDNPLHKTSDRNPSPRRIRRTSEPLPAEKDGYSSTEDKNKPPYIKPSLIHNGSQITSNQRKPKNTSLVDSTSSRKHPKSNIAANLNFYHAPPKKISAVEDRRTGRNSPLPSNGKPADSSGLDSHLALRGTQLKDLPDSRQLKDTFAADSSSGQSKPKATIADGFTANPKYTNSTIGDGSDFKPGQPKNMSTNELNSTPKHSKTAIGDSAKFNPGQSKNSSTDELSSTPKHSKITIGDSTKFNSGQPKNTSTEDLNSNPIHSKSAMGDSTKFNSGQPKNISTDELNSNPKHSNSSIEGSTKFNSGQPKSTSTDELNSNPKHSDSTIGDSTKFNSEQPKNKFTDELNSNTKLPMSTLGDCASLKPGKPHSSSPDEFILNPRSPENLAASSYNHSALMAAGSSSSNSPTVNASTAINPKNLLAQSPLSTEFLVDPAAHTYISSFMKDKIRDILGQSGVEMKTETGEGFNTVILTAKSPHLSQQFYKAAREISDIFIKCQHLLRVESIDLSNISADFTKKLQLYLLRCGIWSLPNGKRLKMIGPYEDIVGFMRKWTSAGGDFARSVHLLQEVSPASARPPVVGMDIAHQSTTHNHNVTHDVHTQRARLRHRSEETGARGGRRGPDTNSRSKTPSNQPWK